MIAVIATVISIIAVGILSQPPPEKIPSVSMEILPVPGNHSFMITHTGGDALQKNDTSIIVDGVPSTGAFDLMGAASWSMWVVGDTLIYQVPESQDMPSSVRVVYTRGSSGHVLMEWGNGTSSGGLPTPVSTTTTAPPPSLNADFSGTPTSGYLPLAVQFTDQSTGPVDQWSWTFGDGNVSSLQSPLYTYPNAGNYTVILLVRNTTYGVTSTATKVNYTQVQSFAEFVSNESVFVYGTKLIFRGNTVSGENATIIVMGPLNSADLDGGAKINVTTIYVDGYVDLGASNVALGSQSNTGNTYINGYLVSQSPLYGEIHVAGNATLTGAKIHGNVSVNGNVTLEWSPTIDTNSYVYYTGDLIAPTWIDTSKFIHKDSLPGFTIPNLPIPSSKSADWYSAKGYVSGGTLSNNTKIYSTSGYTTTPTQSAYNVTIVADDGDITFSEGGGYTITGVLFAPKGKVSIDKVSNFEGVVIARDGLYVLNGGIFVTFKHLNDYIADPADYPF